ncbi:MAG: twin-arginine translocation signal domain-containing protein [Chloroflexi bacterium]|nr:twin-arginine translocation signal domain-containing protein [Chloroflexota bacterium]
MKKMENVRLSGVSRRKFLKLSAAAGAMGVLSAPTARLAAAPAKGGGKKSLIYGAFGGDPGNLSPVIRFDINAGIIMYNIFDNLVMLNYKTRKIEPLVAESWKNIDPLTWQIKLREGVKWHKGYGEVTAEDLVYTWTYHVESKSWQINTALFAVDSVKAVSKYVAEVKLKQPFGAFPGVVMGYGGLLVSKNAHQEMGAEKHSRNPIGNGAFVFDSIIGGREVVLKKNKDYWKKGLPYLEEIVFRPIPDSHVRLQSLEKGELDFITHPDAKDVPEARKNPNLVYLSTPGWNWDYQAFTFPPHQKPDFPNQNKLVRQAISYAVDREAIKKEIYFGEATVTDSPIPEGFLGYRPVPIRYPKNGDLNKAKELMAQAGVKGYEVEVITSDKDWLRRELELVAAMVSQIGITYKIRHHDMGSYNNLWLNNKYQQLLEDITIVSPDPDSTVWWFLHSKGNIASGYNVPEMDKMLDDARAEADPKKREALYHRIVDRTLEDCPKIYHVYVNYVRLHKKGLGGFNPSPQEYIELFTNARWGA